MDLFAIKPTSLFTLSTRESRNVAATCHVSQSWIKSRWAFDADDPPIHSCGSPTNPARSAASTAAPRWERLQEKVEATLDALWDEIAPHAPGALSRRGRSRTARFPLYVYRTFHANDLDEDDPIVAGIEIKDESDSFRVTVDVGGEDSGSILYSKTIYTVAKTSENLDEAVRQALEALSAAGGFIEEALRTAPKQA